MVESCIETKASLQAKRPVLSSMKSAPLHIHDLSIHHRQPTTYLGRYPSVYCYNPQSLGRYLSFVTVQGSWQDFSEVEPLDNGKKTGAVMTLQYVHRAVAGKYTAFFLLLECDVVCVSIYIHLGLSGT